MALNSNALTTVAEVQAQIPSLTDTTLAENLINSASQAIEEYVGRVLREVAYVDELRDGDGSRELVLKNYPVDTAETFTVKNFDDSEVDEELYRVKADQGIICFAFNLVVGCNQYKVTYTGGLSPIPSDLNQACIMLIGYYNNTTKNAGVSNESVGDYQIGYQNPNVGLAGQLMPAQVESVLAKYKRPVIA